MSINETNPNGMAKAAKSNSILHDLLSKLTALVEQELQELQIGRQEFLHEIANKKLRLLAQLESNWNETTETQLAPNTKVAVKKLKETLSNNLRKLELRMQAIDELSKAIQVAVREGESDGTYNAGLLSERVRQ